MGEESTSDLRRRETLSALGELAGGIAHELRNPLSCIGGFAHLLLQSLPEGSDACAEHAHRIIRGVHKANSIISNLLCFARPENFQPRSGRLRPVFTAVAHQMRERGESETRLEMHAPQPVDLTAHCDGALLERLLVNLIDNAIRAAGKDGRVTVSAHQEDKDVVLTVEDDGPGVPEELRERLFLPFVTTRPEGTGLGLAIVHRIVDLHRGRVVIQDRPGGGTVFKVNIPRGERDGRGELPTTRSSSSLRDRQSQPVQVEGAVQA